MKLCKSCGEEKTNEEFHFRAASKDSLSSKCKRCQSEYDKARASNPKRVKARADYLKTEAGKSASDKAKKKYALNNKDKLYEANKKYRENNPKKLKCHGIVGYAIKIGALNSMPCVYCGDIRSHAHHDDYDKPLEVRWLCTEHHNEWHKINGEGINPN